MANYTPKYKAGDKVKFTGATKEQTRWGGCDDPYSFNLKEGKTYTITDVHFHSWHTKLELQDRNGKFNSVCFELVEQSQ